MKKDNKEDNKEDDRGSEVQNTKKQHSLKHFIIIVGLAVLCRIILYYQGFHHILADRNEISTPITSFKRLTEGLHLFDIGLSPYAGSVFHQPPLLLLMFQPFYKGTPQIMFLVIDVLSAILIRQIVMMVPRVLSQEIKKNISSNIVVAIFLFNPFSILTSVGMSTTVVNNLAILSSLYFGLKSNLFLSVFSVACAAYLSIYPIILILPVALLLAHTQLNHIKKLTLQQKIAFGGRVATQFAFSLVSLFYLSFTLFNSWEFIQKCYIFTYLVEDLTPNIGLFWYYFIEVFDHFRNFFLFIFHYHVFIYTIPLAIRFKNHPLFYFWVSCAIIATFKSYPALGDTALHISLLPLLYETLKGVKYIFIIVVVGIYVTVLAPILWQMWVYQGTGNANFYYTINLVFTLAQVLLIADSVSVLLKSEYIKKITLKSSTETPPSSSSSTSPPTIQSNDTGNKIKTN